MRLLRRHACLWDRSGAGRVDLGASLVAGHFPLLDADAIVSKIGSYSKEFSCKEVKVWRAGSSEKETRLARIPQRMRLYAVGDVHGRADLLSELFSEIDTDLEACPVPLALHIFLGDYVDRGPHSREVLDLLVTRSQRHETIFLKGNHEILVEEFLRNPESFATWRDVGGVQTLLSYGIRPSFRPGASEQTMLARQLAEVLPPAHRQFFGSLRRSFSCGDFFFVHAGVRPGVPLSQQADEDLFWIRDEFLNSEERFGKIVVHGHSPVPDVEFHANRINIDTGAFATGRLSCLRIESEEARSNDRCVAGTQVGARRLYL
jgi:serine/threonine protein phosphatase 1